MSAMEKGEGGRPVLKNAGPVLMSPGGTLNFNVPMTPDTKQHESFFPSTTSNSTPATPQRETPPSSVRPKKGDRMKLSRTPVRRELFGGAITIMLPETFEDVSVLREIPDHQEVFVDRDSEVSLIVELLEHDGTISDEHAPTYYFKDLATCNDAENISTLDFGCVVNNVNFMPILKLDPKRCVKCAAVGRQRIVKFRKPVLPGTVASVVTDGDTNSRGDDVIILMCIVRLLDVLTDILITLNVPFIADGTGEDVVPPLPPSKTASSSSASNSGRPDSSRVARAQIEAAARADMKTEASTVVSLLYKAPSPGMLLRATSLEDRSGESRERSPDDTGNVSGKGEASSGKVVKEAVVTTSEEEIAVVGGPGSDIIIDVSPGAPGSTPASIAAVATLGSTSTDGNGVKDLMSSEDRSVVVVGKALKTYHVLFQRPAVASSTSLSTARKSKDVVPVSTVSEAGSVHQQQQQQTAGQLPMYPHAILKTVLETFAIHNWQLFA